MPDRRSEFTRLFRRFVEAYAATTDGEHHLRDYKEGREQGRRNYEEIVEAVDRGEDVAQRVLLKLLPYKDSPAYRDKGAWVYVAPAPRNHEAWLKKGRPHDWQQVALAILGFVRRCVEDPAQLDAACGEFAASPDSRGFQSGILSPILNALRPDDFILLSSKSRRTINYFLDGSYEANLVDYPAANAAGKKLIEEVSDDIREAGLSHARDADLFDMFSHWLVAIERHKLGDTRYWKIAPGEDAHKWEECRDGGFIAIGWDEVGDISGIGRAEFEARRDEAVAEHEDWKKGGVDQVWTFSRIKEGDRVVANRGTKQVLGIGTVIGPYEFVPGVAYGHRLPVDWEDPSPRLVNEGGWRRTLIKLSAEKFEALRKAPPVEEPGGGADTEPDPLCPFSEQTFALLSALHESPTRNFYLEHKGEFKQRLEEPFQRLIHEVAGRMPPEVTAVMETQKGLFARILKNDFGHGGAWDFYWAAFYPKDGKRITDAQLSAWINRDRLGFGFFVGHYASEQRKRFVKNCEAHRGDLIELLEPMMDDGSFVYGEHGGGGGGDAVATFEDWLEDVEGAGLDVSTVLSKDEVLLSSEERLVERAASTFERLFPLVLLATAEDPMPAIVEYLEVGVEVNPEYGITQCSEDTGIDEETLRRWVRAIGRKGQAILYGPPGTGKTHLAQHLAQHLIGGTDGFSDLVQFHPSYAYEDFMQGIRPQSRDGVLIYPVVPGRFLEFCREARKREGPCVLIVDEINRANLSRVFGELMYLLEYRDHSVPLAGGGAFGIPKNVRILGTMNTADRSIALVDHALRRRFAFLPLYPDYDLLAKYHAHTGFPVEGLIEELRGLNGQMEHNYRVGITFFLHENLAEVLEDIWRMEIEPYLEEYFFDQPEKVKRYRWDRVKGTVMA